MGWVRKVIEAGAMHRYTLAEVREGLFISEGDTAAKHSQFWLLLVLSSVVAAGGVVANSTPAVIGAMVIAPLATPIYGAALATSIGSPKALRSSLLLLAAGIAVNVVIAVLVALVFPEHVPVDANPQITGRTAPTLLDLMVALAVGMAGAFALARRDVANIVAGVAIAISLVPVLAVVGITLGSGRLDLAFGAFVLFLTNVAAILVAGVVVFGATQYYHDAADVSPRAARRARLLIAVGLIALIVPLSISSYVTWQYRSWVSGANAAAEQWLEETDWHVNSAELAHRQIVITVVGPGNPPPQKKFVDALRHRVPEGVDVRLIEVSGRTTEY